MLVKVGIIGCGAIAERLHFPGYVNCPEAEVTCVCDVEESRARKMADRFGVRLVYTDWQKLLKEAPIDAVSICLPNFLHSKVTVAAAQAGKHILVEKPMATSTKEAEEMVTTARKNRVVLMVEQTLRFLPVVEVAKHFLSQGIIGKINTIRARSGSASPKAFSPTAKWYFEKEKSRGGALLDVGIHGIDLVRHLVPKKIIEVYATVGTLERKVAPLEDNAICVYRFEDGTFGSLEASWTNRPRTIHSVTLYGQKGTMRLESYGDRSLNFYLFNPDRTIIPSIPPESQWGGACGYFIHCIQNKETPFISGEEGLRSLEIILNTYRASKEGRPVALSKSLGVKSVL